MKLKSFLMGCLFGVVFATLIAMQSRPLCIVITHKLDLPPRRSPALIPTQIPYTP